VTYAFAVLAVEELHAGWFYDNPASGHVLAKLGARHNGSAMRECRARGICFAWGGSPCAPSCIMPMS